ncbi:hypothetical protein Rhal01_02093 [Rubritalea halochordaticola]|uniref:Cadherin domain-containing protein n=1 Tax=Rubritalea halochordaticola TaxID=714537 RepID=A0ABP9UZV6_9BACT
MKTSLLSATALAITSVIALADSYNNNQSDIPETYDVTGITTRTDGTVETYNIPIENWPDKIQFTSIRGGDGGRAKATATVGSDKSAEGGGGAKIIAEFLIHPTASNCLRPGGQLRFIIGSRGENKTRGNAAGSGGGGGTGVLYKAPTDGADWEILAIAGGGGGGAASTVYNDTFDADGKNANNTTDGDDGGGSGRSGGTNGSAGTSTQGDSGGGGSYTENSRDNNGTLWVSGGRLGKSSGGAGGQASGYGSYGGFGCGGGGGGYVNTGGSTAYTGKGGGGGGYSGGGAGGNNGEGDGPGGGGGSYVNTSYSRTQAIFTRNSDRYNGNVAFTAPLNTNNGSLSGPTITLSGSSSITLAYGESYSEPGYSAVDLYNNTVTNITPTVSTNITNGVPGNHQVHYWAFDQFGNAGVSIRNVTIEAPNKPTFSTTGHVTVNEDSGSYTQNNFAYDFNSNDAQDSFDGYTVSNNNNSLFSTQPSINNSGRLTFTPKANAHGTATVSVYASDDTEFTDYADSETKTFTITINSLADNPTNVTLSNSSIVENITAVGAVSATEPFGGSLSYAITGGADSSLFSIGSNNGALAFKIAPDYESPADSNSDNTYQVTVTATGTDGSASQTFTISVTNEDEGITSMVISNDTIVENTTSIGTITATDEDGDDVTYAITGGFDPTFFTIDEDTGALSFKNAPDYEDPQDQLGSNLYIITITATSSGGSESRSYSISVTNKNEAPESIALSADEVQENTTTVGTVTATDPEGGTLNFTISGDDSSRFTIGYTTGVLVFKSAPDYENPIDTDGDNVYEVVVRVTDSTTSVLTPFQITVTNQEEGITSMNFSNNYIQENNTTIGTVEAIDEDGDTVTYDVTGGDDKAFFSIDPDTGELSFHDEPDYETPLDDDGNNSYHVIVTATTSDDFTLATAYTITVTNIDETTLEYFRDQYGLASDGSEDNSDMSGNGIANIFYYLHGLGDPNNITVDATRLPAISDSGTDTITYSFVQPIDNTSSYEIWPYYSDDLTNWKYLSPSGATTTDLGDGYQRVEITIPVTTSQNFYRIKAVDTSEIQ